MFSTIGEYDMNNHETGRERGDYLDPEEYFGPDVGRFAVFARLPDEYVLDIRGLAKCMRCSIRTIHRWVSSGFLPPPHREGGKSIWIVRRIRAWIDQRCEKVEVEAKSEISRISNFDFRK